MHRNPVYLGGVWRCHVDVVAMSIWTRFQRFLFPPSRWSGCDAPSDYERLAAYEIRLGQHKAKQWLRNQRIAQVFDSRATVQPKVTPKLPSDNVLKFKRRVGNAER